MADTRDQRADAVRRLLEDYGTILGNPRGWKSALAKELGVARETLSALINGRSAPSEETLRAIEAVLGVKPDYWEAPGEALFVDFLDDMTRLNLAPNVRRFAQEAQLEEINSRVARLRSRRSKVPDEPAAESDDDLESRARHLLVASGEGEDDLVLHLAPRLALDVIDYLRRRP